MRLKSLKQTQLKHKRVLLLVDYDVPFKNNSIIDDTRIRLSLPTIEYLRRHHAKIIILTKRGRPDGHIVASLRLDPVAQRLSSLLKLKVTKLDYTVGAKVTAAIEAMQPGDVIMLENTRFLSGEATNDSATARQLAALGDLAVNDQFSVAHRAQASNVGIAAFIPVVAGLNLLLEVTMLSQLTASPQRPFVAIIGGAKISDKLPAVLNLSRIADTVLVGGKIAFEPPVKRNHVIYPIDTIKTFDIGPRTIDLYRQFIAHAKTVFWNGPMGIFEKSAYVHGTRAIAQAIARNKSAITIVGGGDTIAAINQFKLAKAYDYVSAAGGAALEFLSGTTLPGIKPMLLIK